MGIGHFAYYFYSFDLNGCLGAEHPVLGDFGEFTTKIFHFRHVSVEILPKTL